MPGVPARLAPPGVTAHEPGHDHLPPPRPPSPLGLGAKPAALGIRRRPMRPSAAANIDASPSSGRRGRPFDAVDGRCQGLLSQSEHGSENRYHHRLTLPGPRPRLPPLKAFGCRPSAPAPNPVQGPATETLNNSRHSHAAINLPFACCREAAANGRFRARIGGEESTHCGPGLSTSRANRGHR